MPNATVLAHQDQHGRAQMPTPRLRRYDGPAILSYGFRPFFLLGSIYSGLAILVWLPILRGDRFCIGAAGLARPRNAVRLPAGRDHRLSADRGPELDGAPAAPGQAASRAGPDLARRA